jgi:hypothetical protein
MALQFLLSPPKLRKVEGASRCLLAHARAHRRHVPARALRSFAGLGNSTGLAVVDARLWLRELFDALSLAGRLRRNVRIGSECAVAALLFTRSQLCHSSQPARVATPPEAAPQAKRFRRPKCHSRGARQPFISHASIRDLRRWATLSRNPHLGREVCPAPTASIFVAPWILFATIEILWMAHEFIA